MMSHMEVLLPTPCPSQDMARQGRRTLQEVKRGFKRRALINMSPVKELRVYSTVTFH